MARDVKIPFVAGRHPLAERHPALATIDKLVDKVLAQKAQKAQAPFETFPHQAAVSDQDLVDAMIYGQYANRVHRQTAPTPVPKLEDFHDVDMIMDMLRRGYAVMKLPEGKLPETLK